MLIGTEVVVLTSTATAKASPRKGSLGIIINHKDLRPLYKNPVFMCTIANILFYRYGYEQKRFELKSVIIIFGANYATHREIKALFKRRFLTTTVANDPRVAMMRDKKQQLLVVGSLPIQLWKKKPPCFKDKMERIYEYFSVRHELSTMLHGTFDVAQPGGGSLYKILSYTENKNKKVLLTLLTVLKSKNLTRKKRKGIIPYYILNTISPNQQLVGEKTSNFIEKGQRVVTEAISKTLRGEL